jgi:hypothetical protein
MPGCKLITPIGHGLYEPGVATQFWSVIDLVNVLWHFAWPCTFMFSESEAI